MSSPAATQATLIGTLWPTTKGFISLRTVILALLGRAFVAAAAVVGYLAQRGWDRNVGLTALAMLIGNIAIYLPGLPWLAVYLAGIGTENPVGAAIAGGLTPFLVGDALKLALAACVLPLAWKLAGRPRRS